MKMFTDNEGRDWEVKITVATIKRVRDLIGVDIYQAVGAEMLTELITDPVKLVDILYAVLKPQADERGVSDEQFGESLGGDAVADATQAFLEELVEFFPKPKRALLARVLEKSKELDEKGMVMMGKILDHPDLDIAMDQAMKDLSGSVLESSESTPTPSPSVN